MKGTKSVFTSEVDYETDIVEQLLSELLRNWAEAMKTLKASS